MTTSGINRRGFTLLEVLLVAALIAISVAIGAPYFAQSIRGNRLQIGARTLTLSARYARSMAVMRQQRFQLSGTAGGNTIRIVAVGESSGVPADNVLGSIDNAFDAPAPPAGGGMVPADISRTLDGVKILEFRHRGGEWQTEGALTVVFHPNGTCTGFDVRLQEAGGRRMLVQVDELGTIRAEPEDHAR